MKRLIALFCCIALLSGCSVTSILSNAALLGITWLLGEPWKGSPYECRSCEPNLPPETNPSLPAPMPMGEK